MGPVLLRNLNASAGPVNTLSPRRNSSDDYVVNDGPPTKRKRQHSSSVHRPVNSPYFLSSKPTGHEDVLDLTRSVSRDDPYDLRSISSTGKAAHSAAANIKEFRNAHPQVRSHPGRKKRKSRQQGETDNDARVVVNSRDVSLDTKTSRPDRRSVATQSPDILADDNYPPPADVVSDVQPQQHTKRILHLCQIESTGPPFKKSKAAQVPNESIEDSEDELSAKPDNGDTKKKTNFSDVGQPRQKNKARGDISPTVYGGTRRSARSSPSPRRGMALKKAACGKKLYDSDSHGDVQISLRPESENSSKLVPTTASGECTQLSWLGVDEKEVFKVSHAGTESSCVVIFRSQTIDHAAKLALEFENPKGASEFVSRMHCESVEKSKVEVEAMVRNAVQNAASYAASNVHTRADVGQQRAEGKLVDTSGTTAGDERVPGERGSKSHSLKDALCRSTRTGGGQSLERSGHNEMPERRHAPETRRTRASRASPLHEPSLDCWTVVNPNWRELWQRSLVFPATGKNRATVDDEDIPRLDEGEFLNDNLISFYLRYLQAKLEIERPELLKKVYIFSSFFFEKLRSTKGKVNYDGVKTWTAKFDLFSYDYIIVPVNEHAHWYLAIICNVPSALNGLSSTGGKEVIDISSEHMDVEMLSSPPSASTRARQPTSPGKVYKLPSTTSGAQRSSPELPRIITLDSLDSSHSATCKALREYLVEEANHKKGVDLALIPTGMTAKKIPHQNNFCDCGVFVLGYTEEFLKDPDEAARKLLAKENPGWDIQPSDLRNKVRSLLFDLQKEQQDRLEKEKEEKEAKRKLAAVRRAAKEEKLQSSQIAKVSSPSSQLADASSTSPRESRNGDSAAEITMTSSASEGVSREPSQKIRQEESPMQSEQSPGRTPQVCNDGELELVSSLQAESSTSTSTPNQIFRSARSSPEAMLPEAAEQTVGKSNSKPNAASRSVDADDLQFVKTMSTSSSDVSNNGEASKDGEQLPRRSNLTVLLTSGPTQKTKSSGHLPPSTRPLISVVERVSPRKRAAGYDGIDRTVDKTVDLT